ncbi:FUSC family protein [Asanoa ishikariensis]|uniref:Aromatic acid exporter family member 1 n=1 Tax=Asanoa ishikariensis TaxID=137265 RepID=A0A1H3RX71_9ACTN|nr:aromatic acid exporter family protein [Asanoa ishikariensis]GIF66757.1 FUSC family protein [Asanoa ishikariensis]SDZ29918.1 Aromatic acid exporter family member 1 [Asanoa ishikariensis]
MSRGSRHGRSGAVARPTAKARRIATEGVRITGDLLAPAEPEDIAPTASRKRRLWAKIRGQEPVPGLRTIKVVLATVLAFALAEGLPGTEPPIVAALTALLVVQVSPIKSIRSGWERIGSVIAGVLLAVVLSSVFGLHWWSLGVTVAASMTIAYALRLGDHALEVPISAMLVLAVAGSTNVGMERVYETLVGAAVAVLVSVALPRVYVQPAGNAIGALAADIGKQLRDMAGWVQSDWTAERAAEGLRRARSVEALISKARDALAQAEDSVRLNPRATRTAHIPVTMRPGLTALEFSAISVRGLARALLDRRSGEAAAHPPGPWVALSLSRLLDAIADAIFAFGIVIASDVTAAPPSPEPLRHALQRARFLRDETTFQLQEDAKTEPAIWRVNGALVGHIDRLINDLDPDTESVSPAITRPRPEPVRPLRRFTPSVIRRQLDDSARSLRRRIRR